MITVIIDPRKATDSSVAEEHYFIGTGAAFLTVFREEGKIVRIEAGTVSK